MTTTRRGRRNSCACCGMKAASGGSATTTTSTTTRARVLGVLLVLVSGVVLTLSCLVDGFLVTSPPPRKPTIRTTSSRSVTATNPLAGERHERRQQFAGPKPTAAAAVRRTTATRLFAASSSDSSESSGAAAANTESAPPPPPPPPQDHQACDVLVLGSGPAGRAAASLLHAGGLDVILSDQNLDRPFPPNYGVWHDEWDAVCARYSAAGVPLQGGRDGQQAIDRRWPVTDCYFGGSFGIPTGERLRVDRAYWRVDRDALRASLTNGYRLLRANHIVAAAVAPNVYAPSGSLVHDETGSTVALQQRDGTAVTVRAQLVVDCTGHETRLVLRESRVPSQPPGFQIAYGCLVDVEGDGVTATHIGPYDKEAMTLFDYRTDHYGDDDDDGSSDAATTRTKLVRDPTFMYAMPLQDNRIFFEETSLVARPAISFQECKDRCLRRLAHHGIRVTKLHEEEFCYIPMGGALPAKDQRVLAVGGAAAMVHPSTGFHLCRCMMGASDVAAVVVRELSGTAASSPSSSASKQQPNLDRVAAAAYHALWSPGNIRQRNFAVFGGDYLMKQDVVGLRGFFDGFFRLPMPLWGGFLAGWPGLPDNDRHETWWARLWFGVNFVARLPPSVALDMLGSIVSYIAFTDLALAQSVTPLLGEPDSYEYQRNQDNLGDAAAKNEARRMILESKVVVDLPVDFELEGKKDAAVKASALKDAPSEVAVTETPVASAKVTTDFQ